ncbi:MAG TPA: tetratricopeptide repeat protein [Rhizomicrobium sp.]|nr:tetratricopeptide repeat protein [Rhizomicrobium sp.]
MTALKSMRFCLGIAAAIAFSPATAGAQTPPWANDQAAADADMANGQYQDAVALYERAIATAESSQPNAATNAVISKMLVNEGNCFLKLRRTQEATAAYEKAAPLSPTPARAYFNLCATYYNTGNTAAALPACDKAIQFDPNKADAYFIKGSLLIAESTSVNGKVQAPPGTVAVLNKYLELAPNGPHASDVRQMLDYVK